MSDDRFDYCSAYCANANREERADDQGAACACGHDVCMARQARALEPDAETPEEDEVKISIEPLLGR